MHPSVALSLLVVFLASCTSKTVIPLPGPSFVKAPRECPFGLGLREGNQIKEGSDLIRLMNDHIPVWLPSGFGLSGAWDASYGTWGVWTDRSCRTVTVTFSPDHSGPSSWTTDYDKPHACGNQAMGMGECIGYSVMASGGSLNVQTIGLSRSDADHVIQSIRI